jgi:hypothetical protein
MPDLWTQLGMVCRAMVVLRGKWSEEVLPVHATRCHEMSTDIMRCHDSWDSWDPKDMEKARLPSTGCRGSCHWGPDTSLSTLLSCTMLERWVFLEVLCHYAYDVFIFGRYQVVWWGRWLMLGNCRELVLGSELIVIYLPRRTILLGISRKMRDNLPSGYDIHSLPWKDPPFLRTVNHLFLWAIYTMASRGMVCGNPGNPAMGRRMGWPPWPVLDNREMENQVYSPQHWSLEYPC